MANRTAEGNVTAEARRRYGMGSRGVYPIFDRASALAAIKLRHHGDVDPARILARAARWARAHNDDVVLAAVARAREVDRRR